MLGAIELPGQIPAPLRLQQDYITGLALPVFLTNAGDGTHRIFIVEQEGVIKVVQHGSRTPTTFLDLSSVVTQNSGGEGLLGLAFHPQYATNRRFFVYYTRQGDNAIQIAEYQASTSDPNKADPTATRVIISIPYSGGHLGSTIAFGPDGYLYASIGDGDGANDPENFAQNINSLYGKMLRIDINTPIGQDPAFNIPLTNPYAGATPGADEIYAIGFRNPYRWSFDRGGTHQIWVGDVGEAVAEEADIVTLGGNYGWRVFEGTGCSGNDPGLCGSNTYTPPVLQYSHGGPTGRCAIIGGYVYRGLQRALPTGAYVYGDFCTGEILVWSNDQQTVVADTERVISSLGEDEDGELYVIGLGPDNPINGGTVDKILSKRPSKADFDGDFRTDLSVFRPSNGTWYIQKSFRGRVNVQEFGMAGDVPTAEDYDGDGRTDIALFRPATATWYYIKSSDSGFNASLFGAAEDVPVAGDYDGDGKADLAVFRPSTGDWHIHRSSDAGVTSYPWGVSGDIPVPGDYDGDGKYDFAVWRPSNGNWYVTLSASRGISVQTYGVNGDIPAGGDFDGDGRNDRAVFRPSAGQWFIRLASGGFRVSSWGVGGDVPVVGDYDGDGADDVAVFRPSTGIWYVVGSTGGVMQFPQWGIAGDLPINGFP